MFFWGVLVSKNHGATSAPVHKKHPVVGDLGAAAAGTDWLDIQKAVQSLLHQSFTGEGAGDVKQRSRVPHNVSRLVPFKSMKKAVMQAVTTLGGGTHKQVQDHLRRNPDLIEGANPSNLERCIQRVRVRRYCERLGKTDAGDIIWGVPAIALPRGVKRTGAGFRADMQSRSARCTFRGPSRKCPQAAKRDHDKLVQLHKTLTPKALMEYVQGWTGAAVGRMARRSRSERRPCKRDINRRLALLR